MNYNVLRFFKNVQYLQFMLRSQAWCTSKGAVQFRYCWTTYLYTFMRFDDTLYSYIQISLWAR